jgi:hypothetical protein
LDTKEGKTNNVIPQGIFLCQVLFKAPKIKKGTKQSPCSQRVHSGRAVRQLRNKGGRGSLEDGITRDQRHGKDQGSTTGKLSTSTESREMAGFTRLRFQEEDLL